MIVEAPSAEALPRKPRLAALLDHFAQVEDPRDVRRILHPLPEVLLLVVCGTIADCDDYEDIAAWGAAHLGFLRRHESWPEKAGLVAIDGKTSRRSHDRGAGAPPPPRLRLRHHRPPGARPGGRARLHRRHRHQRRHRRGDHRPGGRTTCSR